MSNNTKNIYAETITEYRYIAGAQLTADDMGPKTWKSYRQLCDNIAIAAWKSLCKAEQDDILGMSLAGLFSFFGCDAKATAPMQKRFLLSCVQVRKEQSVAMKNAKKALRDARKALDESTESDTTALEQAITVAQAEVDRLASEPMNVWFNKTPMLDSTRLHASAKCRKLIEDTMADVIAERELMTISELQEEARHLKAIRKSDKQAKKQESTTTK